MAPRAGPKTYGRYQITAPLGEGGMALVYRAHDPLLDRDVAIKVVGRELAVDGEFTKRFRREARAIAGLRHPHIVQVYDFGEDAGGHYMVMEFIGGRSLAQRLARLRGTGARMPYGEALTVLEQVAAALDHAHAHGVIHRDVKPGNILLRAGRAPQAVLADFGLALLLNRSSQASQGRSFGTPDYIAPEQALQSTAATAQSDIYSLGVVAYAMLTNGLPFEADSPIDLALLHIGTPPRPMRKLNPQISPAAEAVVLKALAKEPAERYRTAGEFVQALRAALEAEAGKSTPAPRARRTRARIEPRKVRARPRAAPSQNTPRRGIRPLHLALAIAVVVLVTACVWLAVYLQRAP